MQQPPPYSTATSRAPAAWCVALCLALCLPPPRAHAQASPEPDSSLRAGRLFEAAAPLELTLTMNLRDALRDRSDDPPDYPATLSYDGPDGEEVALYVGVRPRGFFRLHHLNCHVPPLRLNFKTKQVAGTVFDGQDKLKLVTHCSNRSRDAEQRLVQEYLLYEAYRQITELSFRTRLARITYADSAGREEPITRYAFFIEDEERMAERNGGQAVQSEAMIHAEGTDREAMTRLALFQYMIGNTDWGVAMRHNVKVVYFPDRLVVVPYDFDWAGLVGAPYATPDPQLGIRSVRERRFMGYCRTEEEFREAIASLQSREEALRTLFRDAPLLDDRAAERAVEYLDEFYRFAEHPAAVRRLQRECL